MFGPLQVQLGRKTLKEAHAIIFTCMTTRAAHLELVRDRSTYTFLLAFRRFVSLRGNPNNHWSDCGTNFIGAQQYLKELLKDLDIPRIQSFVSKEFRVLFSGVGMSIAPVTKVQSPKVQPRNKWFRERENLKRFGVRNWTNSQENVADGICTRNVSR